MIEQLFTLQGKTALITGGGKGIGAMMTQGLIESGADVIIASRSLETCEAFAAEMNKLGKGKCTGMTVDLSSVENITAFAEKLSCLLYTSPSPRDRQKSRMPSSA